MTKKSKSRFVSKYQDVLQLGAAVFFLIVVGVYASLTGASTAGLSSSAVWLLIVAASVGAYMAMNIGANDVANNLGPAVGSGAITMGWAILIAAVFEALGAIVAGGEVVGTIKGGIIDAKQITDPNLFAWVMFAALLAGALWLNLATAVGAPVSTTHSIIGAVMGAGIAAGGWGLVNWGTIGAIVASWVISPLMGGAIAAGFLYLIKRSITYRAEKTEAATRMVPWLIAAMVWAFVTYMMLKGLGQLVKVGFLAALLVGAALALVAWAVVRKPVARMASRQDNSKDGVNRLFTWPLVCSAALLSFAHGANDVANAIGPLAAIYEAVKSGAVATKAATPLWIMVLGALGLAIGLALYGAKLIRTVGKEITELDNMRAYSIAMAATLTVIVASQLGMPVSTTHVTIGAVFGVGFLRELLKVNYAKMEAVVFAGHQGADRAEVEAYLHRFEAAEVQEKKRMLAEMKRRTKQRQATETAEGALLAKKE
ncbi:MAG: inorganic phosphate transporter, partial [Hydrogenophaga sp.]|nr:inorganic phosphate transporter [Hydrogenophaga sp.]